MAISLKNAVGLLVSVVALHTAGPLSAAAVDGWAVETAERMLQRLESLGETTAADGWGAREALGEAAARFYRMRDYRPAWVDRDRLTPDGVAALAALRKAPRHGLPAIDGQPSALEDSPAGPGFPAVLSGPAAVRRRMRFDQALTERVLLYGGRFTSGRTASRLRVFGKAVDPPAARDLAAELSTALDNGRLAEFLDSLTPRHPGYLALVESLERHRQVEARGGWPTVSGGPTVRKGDFGPRVAQLRQRMSAEDETFPKEDGSDRFDDRLADAVTRFQARHGLMPDGVVGARTLEALNVPVEARIRQIQASLERWRWMPGDLGSPHLLVNIPGFQLQVVEDGRPVKTMRAVVGRQRRPTPALASAVTYLEVNPYWNVPSRIARLDLLPKIQENPDFLLHQNFRVFAGWQGDPRPIDPRSVDWSSLSKHHFPYRLRQEPDPQNALGRVKFMFPNDFDVYIHDTPSKNLFQKPSRPFSSGCVRIEEPMELAAYLLERQQWDPERISRLTASRRRQVVVLETPVPVYMVYMTAWVGTDGETHFREDIYGQDLELQADLPEAFDHGSDRDDRPVSGADWLQASTGEGSAL